MIFRKFVDKDTHPLGGFYLEFEAPDPKSGMKILELLLREISEDADHRRRPQAQSPPQTREPQPHFGEAQAHQEPKPEVAPPDRFAPTTAPRNPRFCLRMKESTKLRQVYKVVCQTEPNRVTEWFCPIYVYESELPSLRCANCQHFIAFD
ncbi:hypothetical protein G4O51_12475 [Candidatus Bathyarchaeota archaeon A05DMB-2]|nr:hypothetical protein [Candidatus Bathyarchaeota archaeon A05DMB-2]